MASTIRAGFGHDLTEVADALEAVEFGLSEKLRQLTVEKAGPLATEIRALLPFDPRHRGWRGHPKRRDPGHIRDSVQAVHDQRGLAIRTSHPGGAVHWFGGTINPRTTDITIRHSPGAGDEFTSRKADEIGRELAEAVDRLLDESGL
jgi:hypothetical protein